VEPEGEDDCVVHFQIEDTGIGIPSNKLTTIFEDFTQVDSSATRVYGGTGLGLSISRKLVQLMNGDISVRSTPGHGSTFEFSARMGKVSDPGNDPLPGLRPCRHDSGRGQQPAHPRPYQRTARILGA
jgi:Signal transduction histidine kinase